MNLQNCVMALEMREGNSNVVVDKTKYHNNGTIFGARRQFQEGMYFDGINDYIDCGDKDDLEASSNFTAEAWFQVNDHTERTVVSKRQSSGGYVGWQVRLLSSTSILYYTTYSTTSISKIVTVPDLGTSWHHIAYTITNDVGQLYLDGVVVGTASTGVGSVTTTSAVFSVGSANGGLQFFNGTIDDVRIYNRALTAKEVIRRYYESKIEKWKALQNLFRM